MERPLDRVAASPYLTALAAWVTARVLLAVAWAASSMSWFDRFETATSVRHQGLFLWDGTYYRDLAQHGYDGVATEVQRFFPLFPLLGRWVGWLLGGNDDLGLLVVSNLAALAALVLVYVLVQDVTGDRRLAVASVWWLALFPAASVLVFAYSESLALALALGAVLAVRRERWAPAIVLGVLSGLTRPTGALVAIALFVAVLDDLRRRRGVVVHLAAVVAPGVGTVGYLAWLQWRFDSWRVPLDSQRVFRAGWHEPVSRLVTAVVDVAGGQFRDVFNASFAVGAIVVIILAARRLPVGWTIYTAVTLVIALAANNINSLGRYAFTAFPLAVMVAVAQQRLPARWRWLDRLLLPMSGVLMAGYAVAAWSGRMIP
ncbi:MAG TPA: hypothetical protein PKY13_00115 [Microthrixaceae bacterium]|nr:hypothetical protein [Microthrixaceae bacterium]